MSNVVELAGCKRKNPPKSQVLKLLVDEAQLADLDAEAIRRNASRAQVVRDRLFGGMEKPARQTAAG